MIEKKVGKDREEGKFSFGLQVIECLILKRKKR